MPKEWVNRAKHIREENPDMPKGMEWALATEQYKEKHGHPPKKHKKKKSELVFKLLSLADSLDQKGFFKEADELNKIINETGECIYCGQRRPCEDECEERAEDPDRYDALQRQLIYENQQKFTFKCPICKGQEGNVNCSTCKGVGSYEEFI